MDAAAGPFSGVLELADRAGLTGELRAIVTAANELGLVPRPYRSSVMIAPPANRTRMLFTVWPQSTRDGGRFSIYRWAPAIAEFFPSISERAAREMLGPDGFGELFQPMSQAFCDRLRSLFRPLTAAGAIAPPEWGLDDGVIGGTALSGTLSAPRTLLGDAD